MSRAGPRLDHSNAQATKEFAQVEGLRIEFRRWPGAGLPILLLHEALGSV